MYDLMLEPDREFPVKANMYRHQIEATLFTLRLFDALPGQEPTPGGHGAALRKNGAGDLVHDYVHPRTLASYVRGQMKANQDKAPDWIAPYLSLFTQSGVSIRSATRK